MTEFLLLLSLWPFHHKASKTSDADSIARYGDWPADQSKSGPIGRCGAILEDCISPDICSKSGNVWFYTEEGVTGIGASCDAAKKDWNSAHMDPVRMSRS